MNILTFDIEEWAWSKAGGYGTPEKYAEYDDYLYRILHLLDERKIKATFFCTGMMATDFPQVLKKIAEKGHEIGCHSHRHTWMNKMTEKEAKEDTHAAIDALEQCIGKKVVSYRAPAFSIGESNKWMFEILANEGIIFDSSVYPSSRDLGGFPTFKSPTPCTIQYAGMSLKEYPISLANILGKHMAYSGGGYFRFFPLCLVKKIIAKNEYTMCYFHILDLIPEKSGVPSKGHYESYFKEPGTLKNRYMRYIKSNLGKKNAWGKLENLIKTEDFVNIVQSSSNMDWSKAPKVEV
jgi:polysaccharide deacetylase family protein (PEP-CTERM system associated)